MSDTREVIAVMAMSPEEISEWINNAVETFTGNDLNAVGNIASILQDYQSFIYSDKHRIEQFLEYVDFLDREEAEIH